MFATLTRKPGCGCAACTRNGLTFQTPAELAQQLESLMEAHPCSAGDGSQLSKLRAGVFKAEVRACSAAIHPNPTPADPLRPRCVAGTTVQSVTWHDNWNKNAAPLFTPLLAAAGAHR